MRLIKPVEITPAKLISSNVPETDYLKFYLFQIV